MPKHFDVSRSGRCASDRRGIAFAAQEGGIGIAPGGNINYVSGHAGVAYRTASGAARADALTAAVQRRPRVAQRDACCASGSEVNGHMGQRRQ